MKSDFFLLSKAISLLVILCLPCVSADAQVQTEAPAQPDISSQLFDARSLLSHEDYAGADRTLREALLRAPNSAETHYLLGFTLLHEQKPAMSVVEYVKGAALRAPGLEDLLGFSAAQNLLNQPEDAERSLAAATKLAPDRALTWYLLGRTQSKEGHWAEAEHSFSTCVRLDPNQVQAQANLGLIYEKLQRPEAAITAYKAAIALQESISNKDPQPYLGLGMLLRKQGKAAEAVPLLIMATGSTTPNPLAHQELGLAYEQLRRYDEALGEMKTAVFIAPNAEALHFFLGRIYRETGHQEEATQEFSKAAHLASPPRVSSVQYK
jgi:tetratricopeptide (TPR) repeat protein